MVHDDDIRFLLGCDAASRPHEPGEFARGRHELTRGSHELALGRSGLVRASQMLEQARASAAPEWNWRETAGRLCELAGGRAGANLSLAASLVRDAQLRGEGVAWIQARSSSFFPADLADCGVDLEALIVVRPPRPADLGLAAEWIARSGAFGLIVLDLTSLPFAPLAMQSRLLALAQKHDLGLVCLTEKSPQQASLSSLVSLRADTFLRRRSSLLADALAGSLENFAACASAHPAHDGPVRGGAMPDSSRPDSSRPDSSRPDSSRPDNSRPDNSGPDNSGHSWSGAPSGAERATSNDSASNDSRASDSASGHSSAKSEAPLPAPDMLQLLASFECELSVAKDKRRSRPWRHCEMRRGTPGLC